MDFVSKNICCMPYHSFLRPFDGKYRSAACFLSWSSATDDYFAESNFQNLVFYSKFFSKVSICNVKHLHLFFGKKIVCRHRRSTKFILLTLTIIDPHLGEKMRAGTKIKLMSEKMRTCYFTIDNSPFERLFI